MLNYAGKSGEAGNGNTAAFMAGAAAKMTIVVT